MGAEFHLIFSELIETHPPSMNVGEARFVVKMCGPQHYTNSRTITCAKTQFRGRVVLIRYRKGSAKSSGELGFGSREGTRETAATSKECSKCANYTILKQAGDNRFGQYSASMFRIWN